MVENEIVRTKTPSKQEILTAKSTENVELLRAAFANPYPVIRELNNRSLYHFLKYFWSVVSAHKFQHNWHIEYLCSELEKVAYRVAKKLPRDYDLAINVPPGSTKPVWEEMDVSMTDGTWKKLKDIVVGDSITNMHGNPCNVDEVHKQGLQQCVKIETFGGRNLTVALDHPVLTTEGWVLGGDITEEHILALMHTPKIEGTTERTIDEFKLAGYFIGDGSVSSNNCSVCGTDMEYIDDLIACIDRLGFGYHKIIDKNGVTVVNLKNKTPHIKVKIGTYKGMGRGFRLMGGPRQWVRDIGISGKTSKTKSIPDFVWLGSNEQIASFLSAYFQCDGCVSFRDKGKKNIIVSVCTISHELAIGLQRLFLRLGVSMKIRTRIAKSGFAYNRDLIDYIYYTVDTTNQDSACRFLEKIPVIGPKLRKLEGFRPQRRTFKQEFWPDEVKLVSSAGQLECRCLTVSNGRSFVVDGIVVSNTLTCSIMFPAWCWSKWPSTRFITASYSGALALESAEYCRDLIRSTEFQTIYPDINIKEDKDTKSNFKIVKKIQQSVGRVPQTVVGGSRFSTSVGGTLMGFHGDILIVDDPLNPTQAYSDVELANANRWMEQTLPSRKTNKEVTPTILIMQRLHQSDPTGAWLAKQKENLKHICLPGEIRNYEKQLQPPELKEFYKDDLLDVNRLSWKILKDMEADLGQYGYAGQIGQDPTPPGGGMFKVDHFQIISQMPPLNKVANTVRYWDKAGTQDGGAYTAGVKMSRLTDGRWVVEDVKRGRWSSHVREDIIKQTANTDGPFVDIWMEQEPGSGGKESAEGTIRNLAGFKVFAEHPTGDKVFRADPYSVQVNNGNVMLLNGPWNYAFVEEHRFFPFGTFKDQVDAGGGSFNKLVGKKMIRRIL